MEVEILVTTKFLVVLLTVSVTQLNKLPRSSWDKKKSLKELNVLSHQQHPVNSHLDMLPLESPQVSSLLL